MTTILARPADSYLGRITAELAREPRVKSPHTQRGYRADLAAFETWRADRPLTEPLVEAYIAHLQAAGRAPGTINRALAAIRWWARRLGELAFEDPGLPLAARREVVAQAARVAAVADVRGPRQPRGRQISPGELAALLRVCVADPTPAGARDAALIALAWATGARRGELADLAFSSYIPDGPEAGDLIIHGKGRQTRMVSVNNGAASYLADWLALRDDADGPLFYAVNKGGVIQAGHGISAEALAQMLEKRRTQAGVQLLTWHDFRCSLAGKLLGSGEDLVTVQKLMGHASPATTSNYGQWGEEVKPKAREVLHVPYAPRGRAS